MRRVRYNKVSETEFVSVRTIQTRHGEVLVKFNTATLTANINKASSGETIAATTAENLHDLKKNIKNGLALLGVTFDTETRSKKADRV